MSLMDRVYLNHPTQPLRELASIVVLIYLTKSMSDFSHNSIFGLIYCDYINITEIMVIQICSLSRHNMSVDNKGKLLIYT